MNSSFIFFTSAVLFSLCFIWASSFNSSQSAQDIHPVQSHTACFSPYSCFLSFSPYSTPCGDVSSSGLMPLQSFRSARPTLASKECDKPVVFLGTSQPLFIISISWHNLCAALQNFCL